MIHVHLFSACQPASGTGMAMVAANPKEPPGATQVSVLPSRLVSTIEATFLRMFRSSRAITVIYLYGKGLYALSAINGALVWRFDTEMPLGNSPTVSNGIVYVGAMIENSRAQRSEWCHLWEFSGPRLDTTPTRLSSKESLHG